VFKLQFAVNAIWLICNFCNYSRYHFCHAALVQGLVECADVHFGPDLVQCINVCRFMKMDLMCLNSDLLNVLDDCSLIVAGQYVKWFVILM
jgi:hypothetical protein